jgi:hypothetical protein
VRVARRADAWAACLQAEVGDVACHVDDPPARLAHEEPPHAPRLVGQRVDDVQSAGDGFGVRRARILDLDRDVQPMHLRVHDVRVCPGEDDLRRRHGRRPQHEKARLLHPDGEAEDVHVERAAALRVLGEDDRHRAADGGHRSAAGQAIR